MSWILGSVIIIVYTVCIMVLVKVTDRLMKKRDERDKHIAQAFAEVEQWIDQGDYERADAFVNNMIAYWRLDAEQSLLAGRLSGRLMEISKTLKTR